MDISKRSSLLYHLIFVLRRLFFVINVFLLSDYLAIQLICFMLTNILYLIYLLNFRPLESVSMEVFNEVTTLILSYFMLIYTDFVPNANIKNLFSFVFIIVFCLNILTNILLILKEILRKFKLYFLYLRVKFRRIYNKYTKNK